MFPRISCKEYTFVPSGFSGTWSDYNLYEHDLDAALALVAYTGHSTGQRHKMGLSSEWTTSGNYPKAWRRIDGELRLYKAGSPLNEGTANPDHGPYSERFASQVAECLGLPHVDYTLDVWEGLAPLFDHNLAFFPYDMPSDFDSWAHKVRTMRQSCVYLSNNDLLRHMVGRRHHAWARQLLGIRLTDDASHPVGEARLAAMETLLHGAGAWILEMTPKSTSDIEEWIDADFEWDGGTDLTRRFVRSWRG